jgi:NDP-sugar pyrophosphorylase family protein
MCSRAVILAGGRGTRLRPYTTVLPKPLVPIGEYPVLEIIIRQLRRAGVKRLTLAVNHHANLIQAFFGDGAAWNLEIDYSLEDVPLSTVAPLRLIPDLPDTFLLMNGDVLTDLDYASLCRSHRESGRLFTVAATTRRHTIDYGVLDIDAAGRTLTGFKEKPTAAYDVSMGIYVVQRDVVAMIPPDRPYGFDHLMVDLLGRGDQVNVYRHDGYWVDIGRPDDYAQATDEFERNRERLLPDD